MREPPAIRYAWHPGDLVILDVPSVGARTASRAVEYVRDEHGQFSKDGAVIEGPAQTILGHAAQFKEAGGTVRRPATPEKLDHEREIFGKMKKWFDRHWLFSTRPEYIERALQPTTPGETVLVAHHGAAIAAAIRYDIRSRADGTRVGDCGYLGSSGIVKGAGSVLVGAMLRDMAKEGVGMGFIADTPAVQFWEKMGFERSYSHIDGTAIMSMSADNVTSIAKGLTP